MNLKTFLVVLAASCLSVSCDLSVDNFEYQWGVLTIKDVKYSKELNEFLAENNFLNYPNGEQFDYANVNEVQVLNSSLKDFPSYFFIRFGVVRTVTMNNVSLTSISKKHFRSATKLRDLNLNSNSINSLKKSIFEGLTNLRNIDLSNNLITSIDGAFAEGPADLGNLNLRGNKIESFSSDTFEGIESVGTIDLSSNLLSNFDNFQLKNENSSMYILDVSHNQLNTLELNFPVSILRASGNGLETIHVGKPAYDQIYIVEVGQNQLDESSIQQITSLPILNTLDLSYNNIGTLKMSYFANARMLFSLNLTGNSISRIPFGIFSTTMYLSTLDLSNNNFTEFDILRLRFLNNLQRLKLNGNHLTEIKNLNQLTKMPHMPNPGSPYPIQPNFPMLTFFEIFNNKWTCSYLNDMLTHLLSQGIYAPDPNSFFSPQYVNHTNIKGIQCEDIVEEPTQSPDPKEIEDELLNLGNELLGLLKP